MTELNIYKCDYCGQEFDDEDDCWRHEWGCRYENLMIDDNNRLRIYNQTGNLLAFNSGLGPDDIWAIRVNSCADAQFIDDFFEEMGYEKPIKIVNGVFNSPGLYYFCEDRDGTWKYWTEEHEKLNKIKNKFST